MHTRVALFGASGYAGLELSKILASHPTAELCVAASDRWQGEHVRERLPVPGPAGEVRYAPPATALDRAGSCDVAFLATPAETSIDTVPRLLERGVRLVVDLSGAFRLKDPALYPRHYGFTHPHPGLLDEAVYGLPELFRADLARARLVANPGCYPTASALALAPLYARGLVEPAAVVDAKSGVTGAGRKATEDMAFAEVAEDFRAYRVGTHPHAPEIAQTLGRVAKTAVATTFTAHLLPVHRGILATAYARLAAGADPDAVAGAVHHHWEGALFVRATEPEAVTLKSVNGTNLCRVAARADPETRTVVALAAIDNLVKGAAGQAVQNMNLALGLEEGAGLTHLRGNYP